MQFEIEQLPLPPPLPMVAQQLLVIGRDENLDVHEMAQLIETDPSLTGRVVGLANSAYFGGHNRIYRVEQAIIRLGFNLVRGLALVAAASAAFRADQCEGFNSDEYWYDALISGSCALRLSRHVRANPRPTMDQAFLAGMLHNIGLLALANAFPSWMGLALAFRRGPTDKELVEAISEFLGLDHHVVGGWVLRKWHVPEEAATAAERYGESSYRGDHWPLCLLVGLGARWAEAQSEPDAELDVPVAAALDDLGINASIWRREVTLAREEGSELAPVVQMLA